MTNDFTLLKLKDRKTVFLNNWYLSNSNAEKIEKYYNITILPGRNEELSSTSVNGYNIGINSLLETKYSEDKNITNAEKLEASIKVTKFFISKNIQKKFFINRESISFMPSLFENEDVCKVNNCELFKKLQPIVNRTYKMYEEMYERKDYETKFRNLAYDYLFNDDITLDDTLRKIEDITKIYNATLNKIDFSIEFVTVFLIIAIAFLIFISLIFSSLEIFNLFSKF